MPKNRYPATTARSHMRSKPAMTLAQIAILVLLAMAPTLFVWGCWRHDIVALVVLYIAVSLGLVQAESLCRFRPSGSHHRGSSAGHSSHRFDDWPARCRGAEMAGKVHSPILLIASPAFQNRPSRGLLPVGHMSPTLPRPAACVQHQGRKRGAALRLAPGRTGRAVGAAACGWH
jgi:hypothetical protein